ncbi:MAG TPA: STAS domain-containing protein [Micromonosporaceae bacterium]|nr:STAS domain-containing protein [Micromonosporaceae bacterium]
MEFRVYPDGPGALRVTLEGELDLATVDVCRAGLVALLSTAGTRYVVIDLADLTFVDCAGLSALIVARSRGRDVGVQVRVRRPQPIVATVLRATGTWELLMGPDSEPAAAHWPGGKPEQRT